MFFSDIQSLTVSFQAAEVIYSAFIVGICLFYTPVLCGQCSINGSLYYSVCEQQLQERRDDYDLSTL